MTGHTVAPTDDEESEGRLRILVVEDEESYREALQSAAGSQHFEAVALQHDLAHAQTNLFIINTKHRF